MGDAAPALPPGWREAWSRSRGKKYFCSAALGVSLWSLDEVLRYDADHRQQQQQQQQLKRPEPDASETAPDAEVQRVAAFPAETAKDLDAFETFVQETCKAFVADEARKALVFPHCAEEKRYIINEAADDFELVPESDKKDMGSFIGTFLTLYKAGHSTREKREAKAKADAEARNQAGAETAVSSASASASAASAAVPGGATLAIDAVQPRKRVRVDEPPAAPTEKVTKLGTVTRDRRTIEEIQKDLASASR